MVQNHLPHDHGQTIEQELEHMPSVENRSIIKRPIPSRPEISIT